MGMWYFMAYILCLVLPESLHYYFVLAKDLAEANV